MVLGGNSRVSSRRPPCLLPASAHVEGLVGPFGMFLRLSRNSRILQTNRLMHTYPTLLYGVCVSLVVMNVDCALPRDRPLLTPQHRYPPTVGVPLPISRTLGINRKQLRNAPEGRRHIYVHRSDRRETNNNGRNALARIGRDSAHVCTYRGGDCPRSTHSDNRATTLFPQCLGDMFDEMNTSPEIGPLLAELWSVEEGSGVPWNDFKARVCSLLRASSMSSTTKKPPPLPRDVPPRGLEVTVDPSPDAEWLDWSTGNRHDGSEGHYRCSPCSAGQLSVVGNQVPASGPKKSVAQRDPYFLRTRDGFGARFWHAVDSIENKASASGGPPCDAIRHLYQQHNEDNAEFEAGFET